MLITALYSYESEADTTGIVITHFVERNRDFTKCKIPLRGRYYSYPVEADPRVSIDCPLCRARKD